METSEMEQLQESVRKAAAFVRPLKEEVGRVLVGQEELVDSLLIGLFTNGHVLVEGVPGLAKTLAVRVLSQAIGGEFSRVQFTPDLLPADLTGTVIYNARDHSFSVSRGPIFANLVLADEINRAPAKVQSALLEAMQEGQVTLGGETHVLPSPFLVMATQNPIEQEGTYPLPEAQVDRFLLKAVVSHPARDEERLILERMAHPETDISVRQVASPEDIKTIRTWIDKVYVDPKIVEYVLDLVFATRRYGRANLSERQAEVDLEDLAPLVEYGASPRATLALTLAAKAHAVLDSRAYVVPQDVKDIAPPVLRHRIIPSYEAEAEGVRSEDLVRRLLDELRTP
ncbi:MAG: AAA family ATPase [Verrucomicrobiota bacterium]